MKISTRSISITIAADNEAQKPKDRSSFAYLKEKSFFILNGKEYKYILLIEEKL